MAWFKLNDSLNSLKGQISNVVQEAFTEGIVGQDDIDRQQTDAVNKIESLQTLCGSQEAEVSVIYVIYAFFLGIFWVFGRQEKLKSTILLVRSLYRPSLTVWHAARLLHSSWITIFRIFRMID